MGIWKEIKKAINSTVGTKEIKPLDEIIKETLFASRRFTTSDRVYAKLIDTVISNSPEREYSTDLFKLSARGTFYISLMMRNGTRVYIYKNNVMYQEHTYNNVSSTAPDFVSFSPLCDGEIGDVFSLKVEILKSFADETEFLKDVNFLAEIVDNVNLEVLV